MKTITDDQANRLEGLLTLEEISCTLKNMKNGKNPDLSEISADFFKVFLVTARSFCAEILESWLHNWRTIHNSKTKHVHLHPKRQ